MHASHPTMLRRDATQATLDKWQGQSFKWGVRDCARMVAQHLRNMGHQVRMPPSGSYGTLLGAKRALAKAGYDDLPAALDALGLERIPPAAVVLGDIIQWPSENDVAALGVALGNGRMVAFHPDAKGAAVLHPVQFVAAWRVPCLKV